MASNEKQEQGSGEGDPTPVSIAQLVGERLREAREEAGVRQSDIAQAAVDLGFKWGRSSVAALEAGDRKLTVEELMALQFIMQRAGLSDRWLIRDTDSIQISDTYAVWGRMFRRLLLTESEHQAIIKANRETEQEWRDALFRDTPIMDVPQTGELMNPQQRLVNAQFFVDRYGLLLLGLWLWPQLDESNARQAVATRETETDRKVAAKIGAIPNAVSLMSFALWGRSLTAERDARAEGKGAHEDARSLQGARAYVTRELTNELREAWNEPPPLERPQFPTKGETFSVWADSLQRDRNDAQELERLISRLAKAATKSRGVPLEEIPRELREIFSEADNT